MSTSDRDSAASRWCWWAVRHRLRAGRTLPGHEHTAAGSSDGHAHGSSGTSTPSSGTDLLGLSSVAADGIDSSSTTRPTPPRRSTSNATTSASPGSTSSTARCCTCCSSVPTCPASSTPPDIAADGTWTATTSTCRPPAHGTVVFDGSRRRADPLVVGADVLVPGTAEVDTTARRRRHGRRRRADGAPRRSDVHRSTPTDDLAPYLGQSAHLVAIRQGDLAYVHLHPANDVLGDTCSPVSSPARAPTACSCSSATTAPCVTVPFTVVQP